MAIQDVRSDLWQDERVEQLTPYATCLFLWMITNHACNVAGIYRVSPRTMQESNCPPDKLDNALKELTDCQLVEYEDRFLWIKNRIKHLRSGSPNVAKAVTRIIEQLPDNLKIKQNVKTFYLQNPVKWLNLEGSTKTLPNTYQDPTKHLGRGIEGVSKGAGEGREGVKDINVSNSINVVNNKEQQKNDPKIVKIIETFNTHLNQNAKPTKTNTQIIQGLLNDYHQNFKTANQLEELIKWAAKDNFWHQSAGLNTITGLERNIEKLIASKQNHDLKQKLKLKNLNTKKPT